MQHHNEECVKGPQGGHQLSRREFVQRLSLAAGGTGIAAAGLGMLTRSQHAEAAEMVVDRVGKIPLIKLGERMGDMMVGRIAISSDWNRDLYGPGLAAGANFVHKVGRWGPLPEDFKVKDGMLVSAADGTPIYTDITVDSTPDHPDDYDKAYSQVSRAIEKTGLAYIDIFRAHFGWRTVDAFKKELDPTYRGTYAAFKQLKKEGKVKHFGVSQHTGGGYPEYPEIIEAEIDSGIIDSMQVWMHYGVRPEALEVFAKAHKAGIGMCAMKVIAQGGGAMSRNADLQKQLDADGKIGRACTKWVLNAKSDTVGDDPVFHMCVLSIGNLDQFGDNVSAVGVKA